MTKPSYFAAHGGLPGQDQLMTGRARVETHYAVIPKGVMSDIVTSNMPGFDGARFWVLARPMSGFAETFSYYIGQLDAGGGSQQPEPEEDVEAVIFVTAGALQLSLSGETHDMTHDMAPGGYAFVAPGEDWSLSSKTGATFHWIRKRYQPVEGLTWPKSFVTDETKVAPNEMPDTNGAWSTTRFVEPSDLSHDMHVNIVNFLPGGSIPFEETHVMEHGLFVLQGKAVYKLNQDWVEVEAGDFIWLRAFCPQACYAGGPEPFRYLLYKDVNRHAELP